MKIKLLDRVRFQTDDSLFEGVIISLFDKYDFEHQYLTGPSRCIVQNEDGICLIKNPARGEVIGKINPESEVSDGR